MNDFKKENQMKVGIKDALELGKDTQASKS